MYCYLIGWTQHNKWYYGRRTATGCRPEELWVSYFTSSNYVKQFRELHGEPDVIEIRREFSNAQQCALWESRVLSRLDAAHNDRWLNAKNGDAEWHTSGIPNSPNKRLNIQKGIQRWKQNTDPILLAELQSKRIEAARAVTTGVAKSIEHRERISSSLRGRSLSPEHRANLSAARLRQPKLTCPYCGKLANPGNATRHHFENCKIKPQLHEIDTHPQTNQ